MMNSIKLSLVTEEMVITTEEEVEEAEVEGEDKVTEIMIRISREKGRKGKKRRIIRIRMKPNLRNRRSLLKRNQWYIILMPILQKMLIGEDFSSEKTKLFYFKKQIQFLSQQL